MANEFIAEGEAFEKATSPESIHSVSWFHIFFNGFTGCKAKKKLYLAQTMAKCVESDKNRLEPIDRNLRKVLVENRYRKLEDTILQINQVQGKSKLNLILNMQEHIANMMQVWGKICTMFSHMEVLFRHANEKMTSISIKSSSSNFERLMAYQRAFEGVKMFEDLSKFTKVYLTISKQHFMPMLASLTKAIDYEGKDLGWIILQKTAFEDKMDVFQNFLAIEYSKL